MLSRMAIFICLIFFGCVSVATASPIKDLEHSIYGSRKKKMSRKIYSFPNNPNLAMLFGSKNPAILEGWLGVVTNGFAPQARWTSKLDEDRIFLYRQKYLSNAKEKFDLSIFITHPAYTEMFDLGLFEDLNRLEPPTLEIISSQEVDIRGRRAMLYQQSSGGCSILLKLQHRSVFQIQTDNCDANQSMLDLARRFDFTRLEQKIESKRITHE